MRYGPSKARMQMLQKMKIYSFNIKSRHDLQRAQSRPTCKLIYEDHLKSYDALQQEYYNISQFCRQKILV